jgi:hypothetical protein
MKGPLHLDRARHDFGVAAGAVRQLLDEWEGIDWFEPMAQPAEVGEALFREHQRLARLHLPQQFAPSIAIRHRSGDWADFVACCQAVRRGGSYDWKMGPLKDLLHEHCERHAFSIKVAAPKLLVSGAPLDERCLFIPFGGGVVWGRLGPLLDLASLGELASESAWFYLFYATSDAMQAIEWQLADPRSSLSDNPFVPLLRCYARGFYPFAHSPTDVLLFRFAASVR